MQTCLKRIIHKHKTCLLSIEQLENRFKSSQSFSQRLVFRLPDVLNVHIRGRVHQIDQSGILGLQDLRYICNTQNNQNANGAPQTR